MKFARSLRSVLSLSILLLTVVAVVAGASLFLVTNSLDRVSRSLSDSLEGVRISNEVKIGLLFHARIADPLARIHREATVERNLRRAGHFIGSDTERQIWNQATTDVEEYFAATREGPPAREGTALRLDVAFRGVEDLAEINVLDSLRARREARALTEVADLISLVAIVVVVVVASLVLWWLNRKAFRPSLALARAMMDFARGRWKARAPETGPAEIRTMAAHFNEMAASLADQRESQAAFLAGVAHDLRTPLGALKMSAAAIPPDRPLPSEERIRKTMAVVDRQVDHLTRMVNDFLDTAQIEAGNLTLAAEHHDLRVIARNVVDLFADSSPRHRLVLKVPEEPVWVSCDTGRMEQVLTNLTSNAIKYSPGGGDVCISVQRHDDRVRLSVADEGLGIAEEDQVRLYAPFRRARMTGRDIPGAGLGLFVTRRLVEAHHGSIELTSAPGRGSTFSVWLPLAPAVAEHAPAA